MKKVLVRLGVLAALALIAGCDPSSDAPPAANDSYAGFLYLTDTQSGKIFTYDPASRTPSSMSLASTGQNSTGELAFDGGIGYACVGMGASAGVYRFDPAAANPSFSKIGNAITAQYMAFPSSTKAYAATYGDGLYSFDPSSSNPSFSMILGTGGMSLQEVIVGADGMAYAADNGNGAVLRIDHSENSIELSIGTSTGGTTGLASGTYGGDTGVFVANTGGYDEDWLPLPGSIDFIASEGTAAKPVAGELPGGSPIYPARLVQLDGGDLVATGYGHTYLVDLSGENAVVSEILHGGAAFGGLDIAYKDGLVYIPVSVTSDYVSYTNYLYILDEDGDEVPYSPVSVMGSSESVSCLAFYED